MKATTMKELRENVGLRTEEVAVQMNVTAQTIRLWEKGRFPRTIDQAEKLAEIYQVTPQELLAAHLQTANESKEAA